MPQADMQVQEKTYAPSTIRKHRAQWLKALESGELSQVKGQLVKTKQSTGEPIGFCCLGVASDLAKVPCMNVKGNADNKYRNGYLIFADDAWEAASEDSLSYSQSELLPQDAMRWLGLLDQDPIVAIHFTHRLGGKSGHRHGVNLTTLNDSGVSFKEIASLVREFGFIADHDSLKQG